MGYFLLSLSIFSSLFLFVSLTTEAFFYHGGKSALTNYNLNRYHQYSNSNVPRQRKENLVKMMVFDFFKERAEEGFKQVENIAKKTAEGKLNEAFEDTSKYISERRKIDAENLDKFFDGLARSRGKILSDLTALFDSSAGIEVEKVLESLEEILMMADIGAATTREILSDIRSIARKDKVEPEDIKSVLRARMVASLSFENDSDFLLSPNAYTSGEEEIIDKDSNTKTLIKEESIKNTDGGKTFPQVLFVIGANGMGKTTTVGKISSRLKRDMGKKVLVAACDTFRAAAVDQLQEWCERSEVDIHIPAEGQTKPAPVLQDALDKAIKEDYDVVIVDTSGRLSNNVALNEELVKLKTVIATKIPNGPQETLLVLDGALGRNAVDQARVWNKEVGVSGLVITKLDGTARGGAVVSIAKELKIPVKLIGVGEGIDDLRDFDAETFVDALLGYNPEEAAKLVSRMEDLVAENKVNLNSSNSEGEGGNGKPSKARASNKKRTTKPKAKPKKKKSKK